MAARIIAFTKDGLHSPPGWAEEERAQIERVIEALGEAGIALGFCEGVSDEGDPWAVWCSPETDEVLLHVARIGGTYRLYLPGHRAPRVGKDLAALLDSWFGQARAAGHAGR